jgi:hypothetical protein
MEPPHRKISKKIIKKVARFSTAKNTTQPTTIHHAIHHNLTTIHHHKSTPESQNPLQKPPRYPCKLFSASKPKVVETCSYP